MPDAGWWQALWPDPAKVLKALGVRAGSVGVDLCCGDGLFTAAFAGIADRVYAIDLDALMLDLARAHVAAAKTDNCILIAADAMAVDTIVPEPVDCVFLANTFHGVPDQRGLSLAVRRILKPDGLFAIVNWHRRPREETVVLGRARGPRIEMRLEPATVAAIVEAAGFATLRTVELPPYHYGIVFRKGGAQEPTL
jgi:ubiquinone/menaquinone biosynthesis C-methylase UbiE